MSQPTPEQLKAMRAGAVQSALEGKNTDGLAALYDLVTGEDPGPEPDKT